MPRYSNRESEDAPLIKGMRESADRDMQCEELEVTLGDIPIVEDDMEDS